MQEEPTGEEQMPFTDSPLSKEQVSEEQIQFVEQTFSKKVMPTPHSGAVVATEVPFEGRASFEGPLSEMPLEGQIASRLHEEPSSLTKPTLEPMLEEPITTPNA